jgi:HD-GYP domain-containing protein (c-di-GMP phosphodiesterase class II)
MFSSFELPRPHRGRVARHRLRQSVEESVEDVVADDGSVPTRLLRYLPLVLFTTVSVVVAPAVLVAALVPRGGSLLMVTSTASAVAVSVAIASAESALWTRRSGSRDLVFADLMLWGWLRRCLAERRLAQARALYDSAKKAGLTVSIELLEELSKRLEARDAYTHGHDQRVARHAEHIARAMHLSQAEIVKIRAAATVHDVGKIYTPREILNNPGRLTDQEYAIVKLHAHDGADMLSAVGDPEIAAMVRHHHERVDGHGYPDGLAGSDIPLGARIIAVADTFDAITSNRPYRPVGTHKRALDILSQQAGSQLYGPAVAAFLSRYSARRSIAWFAFATVLPQRILVALQTASSGVGASTGVVTSLLPAIGTAGLLSFSPGLHHDAAIEPGLRHEAAIERSAHLQADPAAVTQSHRPAVSRTPTTGGARHAARQTTKANIRLAQPEHRQIPGSVGIPVRTPLGKPVSQSPRASTPPVPNAATTSPREPVTALPTGLPSTTSLPTPPAPAPTPSVPPVVKEAPAPPGPSIPTVTVTVPGLPPVSTPSISISTGEGVLGIKTH